MVRVRVAGIIPYEDGIVLMHRVNVKNREYSEYYTFPGGGLEEGETKEEGVVREVEEELGIIVESEKLIYNFETEKGKEYFYLCKYIKGEIGTGTGPEFSGDPKYIDSGEFIPKIIKKDQIEKTFLLPFEAKEKLIELIKLEEI